MTRLPRLPVRIDVGGGLAKHSDMLTSLVEVGVDRVATALGLILRPEVSVHASDRLLIEINGVHAYFSHNEAVRARMHATRTLLAIEDADLGAAALAHDSLDSELRVQWLAALVESVLIARPEQLVTNAVIVRLAQEVGDALHTTVKWTVLGPLLRGVLAQGLSVASLATRVTLMQRVLAASGQDAIEQLISGLHPMSAVTLWLDPRDLQEMLERDIRANDRPLSAIHERARAELGIPLAGLRLRFGNVERGTYRLQINNLPELSQPLLSPGFSLGKWGEEMRYVPAWRSAASAIETTDASACTSLGYFADDVFDLLAARAPRIIERERVHEWCCNLGKPTLHALAMTSDHYQDLPRVLRVMLAERTSIRDLSAILERIIDHYEVDTPAPRTHMILSQAFPVTNALPPANTRIVESVRLAQRSRLAPYAESSLRVYMLTPTLERELVADPAPSWRDQLVDEIAALDLRAVDAILTTIEVRTVVRGLSEAAHPDVPVLSFQDLPIHAQVNAVGQIDFPKAVEVRPKATRSAKIEIAPEIAEGFGLLLADGAVGVPAIDELFPDDTPPAEPPEAPHSVSTVAHDPLARPDSLAHQGWALVIPANAHGDAMRRAIAPLERYRCDVQDAAFEVFRVTPEHSQRPRIWIQERFEALPLLQRPRYVLILGDFSDVSLELQLALRPLASVGRLAFDSYSEFSVYAEKAVAVETNARLASIQPLMFCASDDSHASKIAKDHLVNPAIEAVHKLVRDPKRRLAPMRVIDNGKKELLAAARDANFLFSASHGAGGKMSYDDRRVRQGALLTQRGEFLTADDVASHPFLPYGAWFMLACYGAGTPRTSSYAPWLDDLYRSRRMQDHTRAVIEAGQLDAGEAPFVSALPRKALANPQGPLVVIGHVDLAWTYSFTHDGRSRFDRLFAAVRVLLHGRIAGLAMEQIASTYLAVSDDLGNLFAHHKAKTGGPEVDARDVARLWMLRQDLRNYILLGDPAARLRLGEEKRP